MKYGYKYIQALILSAFMSLIALSAMGQANFAFYPIEDQFNSSSYNPAFLTSDSQFTFSMFPLAGMNLGYNNQKEIQQLVNKLLSGINEDAEYLELVRTMVDHSTYMQKLEADFLNFTYRSQKGFFNFRIRENISLSASLKGPVSRFMIKPEVPSIIVGQVQNAPILIIHYREYSLGYSSPVNHGALSWGVRAKLYYGKGAFSSTITGSVISEEGSHFLKTAGEGKMSIPVKEIENNDGTKTSVPNFSPSNIKDYLMNAGNTGLGFDLGVKYKITPKLTFSASMLDLGNIKWNTDLTSKDFDSESMLDTASYRSKFGNGVETITKTSDSISFEDKFSQIFKTSKSQLPFATILPTTFYAGINYQLNPIVKLNLVDRFIRLKNFNHNSILASANFNLNNGITLSTGYSILGNSYLNIPLAILFKRNFGQIYIGTDNLFALAFPSGSEFSGITFGSCFYLFQKRNLYGAPNEYEPFHRPKKVKKVRNTGRILKEYPEFGFPE